MKASCIDRHNRAILPPGLHRWSPGPGHPLCILLGWGMGGSIWPLCSHSWMWTHSSSTWPQSHFYLMSTSSIKLFSGWHWSTFVPLEGLTWFSIWHSVTQLKLGPCCLCVPVKEKAHPCRPHLQFVCAMRFTAMGLAWVTLSTLRKQNSRHKPQ